MEKGVIGERLGFMGKEGKKVFMGEKLRYMRGKRVVWEV